MKLSEAEQAKLRRMTDEAYSRQPGAAEDMCASIRHAKQAGDRFDGLYRFRVGPYGYFPSEASARRWLKCNPGARGPIIALERPMTIGQVEEAKRLLQEARAGGAADDLKNRTN